MEGRIFINYRREINAAAAGRLSDRLSQHFDHERLFMDVDGIEPGVDFVKALDDQVAQCSAFIAVIGPGWTDLKNAEGRRRLDQANDYVRIEIESALKRDIRVIPVLVDGAHMPRAEELPDSLKPFSRRNAVTLSHQRFGSEVDELARTLRRALGLPAEPTTTIYPAATTYPIATTYPVAATETPTSSWVNHLFSFEGRISRKSFFLSNLILTVAGLLVMGGIAAVLGKERAYNPETILS
ncbi:MAG TPA: TIR domain-containing protein, partial [Pseudolabrys sp.]|nr:TIR domain-containing protein [Pseudolabrys sp.]